MLKYICNIMLLASLISCAETYNVQGTSSLASFDGNKMYLTAIKDNELKKIDSCDVIHGKFELSGNLDTTFMATLFINEESIMPIVLEKGDIIVNIDNACRKVSGTPLNEILYDFLDKINQLNHQRNELAHKHTQMLLDGKEEEEANQAVMAEANAIAIEEDQLIMKYITENFDNVIGPGIFMMLTSNMEYPELTPQIEHIMTKATDKFKNDPYVKEYIKTANENEIRMQGLAPDDNQEMPADSIQR